MGYVMGDMPAEADEVIYQYYVWIVVVSSFFMFGTAMGIGANDVANAFATSVGSKALTLKSAIIIASICELGGAILMGSHVTETIRKGIAKPECFEDIPAQFMYGCMCVLGAVFFWLFLASKYEMPVSTTHSVVGGMIGMAMVLGGPECVVWYTKKETFPYVGGVAGIVASWIFSPVLSLLVAMALYGLTRWLVLRPSNSYKRTFFAFPILVALTITLNSFFIIYKGGKGIGISKLLPEWAAVVLSFGIGIVCGCVMIPFMRLLRKYIDKKYASKVEVTPESTYTDVQSPSDTEDQGRLNTDGSWSPAAVDMYKAGQVKVTVPEGCPAGAQIGIQYKGRMTSVNVPPTVGPGQRFVVELPTVGDSGEPGQPDDARDEEGDEAGKQKDFFNSITEHVHRVDDATVASIHDEAEKFGAKTEESFKYVQIFTAICDSWSHGANDIANSVGPFAAIYSVWMSGRVVGKTSMGNEIYWILTLGAIGIDVGLLVYGHKIIKAIGTKLAKITPSRGFAIELSSALIIIIGSRLGIPLSTTHCQVGATVGIGLLECGGSAKQTALSKKSKSRSACRGCQCLGVNCKVLLKTVAGWVITLVVAGVLSAVLTAQGVFAPSKSAINSNFTVNFYQNNSLVLGWSTYVQKGTPL